MTEGPWTGPSAAKGQGIDAILHDDESTDGHSAKKLIQGAGVPGGIAILFVLLRILAVSHWNWNTATSVAATIDLQSIVQMGMGTLFARPGLTGFVVMILLPLVVFSLLWPTAGESRWSFAPMLFATVLGAIAVSRVLTFRSWWLPVGVAIIAGGLALVYRRWSGVLEHRVVVVAKRSMNVVILLVLLGLAAAIDTPWLEREQVTIVEGSVAASVTDPTAGAPAGATRTIRGYVLEVDPGFVRMLTDDREVELLRLGQVVSRQVIRQA